jgi:hypothetical protein
LEGVAKPVGGDVEVEAVIQLDDQQKIEAKAIEVALKPRTAIACMPPAPAQASNHAQT